MKDIKLNTIMKYGLTVIITAVISITATFGYIYAKNYSVLHLADIIDEFYYGEINELSVNEGAMTGMVAGLNDPHSYFVSSEYGADKFQGDITGDYVGIGVTIQQNSSGYCDITNVFDMSPAKDAGIMVGDIIIKVSDKSTKGLNPQEVSNLIIGKEGTNVNITIKREDKEIIFDVIRKRINAQTVFDKKFDNVGYLLLTGFDDDTDEELKRKIDAFNEVDGLIIDLRNNGGGLLDTGLKILNMFINEGNLIVTEYKDDKIVYEAKGEKIYDMPLVVLTNSNSASASEFFTAAIKENKRGISVGENTYGKGSIQTIFELPDNTCVNLTIGAFFTPDGNKINKIGIKPDVVVQNPDEYKYVSIQQIPFEKDAQLQKAIEILK